MPVFRQLATWRSLLPRLLAVPRLGWPLVVLAVGG